MKKRIVLITLILSLYALTGCSRQAQVTPGATTDPVTTEAPAATQAPETAAPETTAPPETTASVKDVTISVETMTENETVRITYPSLSGLKDSKQEKTWNDFFFEEARKEAEALEEGSVYACSWEVVSGTARLISLVQKTQLTAPAAADPVYGLKTYNLDSSTGKAVRLFQLCDINAIAADLAAADEAVAKGEANTAYTATAPDGTDVTAHVTMDELLELHSKFVTGPQASETKGGLIRLLNSVDYDGGNAVSGYSYWKEGILHLVFSYTHAVGDYVDIQIKDAHRNTSVK